MKLLSTISEQHVDDHLDQQSPDTDATTNNDTASVYGDLIEFLHSTRADLRLEATKAVLQVVDDR